MHYRDWLALTLSFSLLTACGDTGAASTAQDADPGIVPAAPGLTAGADGDPCALFTTREVAAMVGAQNDLEAVPDEHSSGMKSCSWRNRQREGGMLIIQACDPSAPWGLNDEPRTGAGGRDGCFWQPIAAHQQAVPDIGRQARVWLMAEEGMPTYWVAEALAESGTAEVWVSEFAGQAVALAFLRAALDRLQ